MSIEEIKEKLRNHKQELKQNYKIKDIGIFGSYIKSQQNENSDLDILVEFEPNAKLSLLDVAGLEIELSELLGVKVDLVEKQTLKPYIGKHILQEVIFV